MRLGCLLPLVSIAMIFGGGQSLYTAIRNRKPVEISIDSLIEGKTEAKWLRITGGVLDTTNSAYPSAFGVGKATSMYVPLMQPDRDSDEDPIQVLVLTKDQGLLDFTNELRKFDEETTVKGAAEEFIAKNLDKLRVPKSVEGLVQYGIDSSSKRERKLHKIYGNLAEDAIILEEGEKPSMGLGVFMLFGGLALGGFLMKSSANKPNLVPMPQAGPPPLPPQ
jgi:hypothetical protein